MHTLREQMLILGSTPLYALLIGVEIILSNLRHRRSYEGRDTVNNFLLMLFNGSIDVVVRGAYLWVLQYFFLHQIFHFTSPIAYWFLLILLEDFLYYWLHRFDHEVRFFWAVHVTHHSSDRMNLSVGFRSSVFQPLYRFIYFIPMAWLGFRPLDIAFIYSATQIWGILVHTEILGKLGWLEYLLVTPSHHRVHHASNPKYLDRNMGMLLIVWDQLFGTFQPELSDAEYQPKRYGLTKPVNPHSMRDLLFGEWIDILRDISNEELSFSQKWKYIFGKPGWSHDGSRKTSDELRREEAGEPPILLVLHPAVQD